MCNFTASVKQPLGFGRRSASEFENIIGLRSFNNILGVAFQQKILGPRWVVLTSFTNFFK